MVWLRSSFASTVLFLGWQCTAFNPSWAVNYIVGLLTIPVNGPLKLDLSQWGRPHEDITEKGVTSRYPIYFEIDERKPFRSMIRARQEIIDGSKVVDDHDDVLEEAENPTCHFDDETLFESNERLRLTRNVVAAALTLGDVTTARNKLGRALHTLQDFYSHTNWVELQFKEPSKLLGRSWPLELDLAPKAVKTCQDCEYPFPSDLNRGGIVLLDEACRKLAILPGKAPAQFTLPNKIIILGCMTTPQLRGPFYGISPICDSNILPPLLPPASTYLTSGYFGAEPELHLKAPGHKMDGKCSHGGPFDRDATGREGISKDTQSQFMSPHWFHHKEAARLAELATIQYLDDLKDDLCGTADPKNCARLRLLYGLGPTLSFAIDTTGSMEKIISGVRDDAIRIVNERRGSEDAPILYVLARFNDPVVPAAQTFTDADQFIAAIHLLTAGGDGDGGDCPELAMTGLNNAVEATSPGGQVFLWTDARAKDAAEAAAIVKAANKKDIQVNVFQFLGPCSTPDGFTVVTSKTGGKFHNGLGVADAGSTSNLATTMIRSNIVDIWNIEIGPYTFGAKRATDRSLTFDIPVDSSIDFISLSFSGIGINVTITRPDDSVVSPTDSGVTKVSLVTGMVVTIEAPVKGIWKVQLIGNSAFSLSVFGKSPIQFSKFEFVELRGSHHEGWFKVHNTPLTGSIAMGHAIVDGEHTETVFELRSLAGTILSTLSLTQGTGNGSFEMPANYFYGNLSVPYEAFNVYITGKDSTGLAYQRMLPGILDIANSNSSTPTTTLLSSTNSLPGIGTTSTSAPPFTNSTFTISSHDTFTATEGVSLTITNTVPEFSETTATTIPATRTVCPTCQPIPTDIAITALTRTIIYYTSCPVTAHGSVTYSTSTITTTIDVPCYSECHKPLSIISPPLCSTEGVSSTLGPKSDVATSDVAVEGVPVTESVRSTSYTITSSTPGPVVATVSAEGNESTATLIFKSPEVSGSGGSGAATPTAATGNNGTTTATVPALFTGSVSSLGSRSIARIFPAVVLAVVLVS